MHFTSETRLDQGPIEREFTLGDIPGILWTPPTASTAGPVPLILLGQPGGLGLRRMHPRLEVRARSAAAQGFASVALELPGAGDRHPLPGAEQARADLVRAISVGERPDDDIIDRLILPIVERAVPEWQAA
ncbi:MAG TPA: alpha/beta hydrolase, partial [Microbacterium ginsengisoli]|nr:alpha/beta hydrolase [Microbacterium ginsengisoli]